MTVKTIFNTLLGTIATIVVGSVTVELFNVCIYSSQMANLSKVAANQACALFTQETYKDFSGSGAVAAPDVVDRVGNTYISGDFYPGSDVASIYMALYTTDEFKEDMEPLKSTYKNLEILMRGIEANGSVSVPTITWESSDADIQANRDASKANQFFNDYYTPANIGIPYMDKETVSKMFRWNLAQLYSNCDPDCVQIDQDGKYFVNYKGFRCYVQDAQITNCTYTVYDMSTAPGSDGISTLANAAVAAEFKARTGYNVAGVNGDTTGITVSTSKDLAGNIIKDNAAVTVVEIDYTVPVSYEGVTPLRDIFAFVWNNSAVDGVGGTPTEHQSEEQIFDDTAVQNIDSTSLNGSATVPSAGKLTFTLVK